MLYLLMAGRGHVPLNFRRRGVRCRASVVRVAPRYVGRRAEGARVAVAFGQPRLVLGALARTFVRPRPTKLALRMAARRVGAWGGPQRGRVPRVVHLWL